MTRQPRLDFRPFVGGLAIEDDVDGFVLRQLCLDGVQEANELLMSVTLHIAADHRVDSVHLNSST
jgi:hypothetical protein